MHTIIVPIYVTIYVRVYMHACYHVFKKNLLAVSPSQAPITVPPLSVISKLSHNPKKDYPKKLSHNTTFINRQLASIGNFHQKATFINNFYQWTIFIKRQLSSMNNFHQKTTFINRQLLSLDNINRQLSKIDNFHQ